MDGWQIAVLVCMIVVFVLCIATIVGVFYWKVLRNRRSSEPHLFYFFDYRRKLRVMDLSKFEKPHHEELPSGLGVSSDGAVTSRGRAPVDMHNPTNFIRALAAIVGDGDPDTMAVSRADRSNVLVELDLPSFLHPTIRDASMRSTATVPCSLSRHFTYIEAPVPMPGAIVEMTEQNSIMNGGHHAYNVAAPNPISATGSSGSRQITRTNSSRYLPSLPAPIILPVDPCLTTSTLITVSLAHYEYADTHQELEAADSERLEAALQRGLTGMIALTNGAFAEVSAGSQSAVIHPPRGGGGSALRVSRGARTCQRIDFSRTHGCVMTFAYDGDEREYVGPFTLPSGRQSLCVTARAPGHSTRSSSKVYTVEA